MFHTPERAAKARAKRILELNADNYKEQKIEIPVGMLKGAPKSGKTVNSRRILASKKSLLNHLDGDVKSYEKFLEASPKPSRYPTRPKCNVCGYFGDHSCVKCGINYCGLTCLEAHHQTMCRN